jgi:hypothetical protein
MRAEAALALANLNIDCIAQNLKSNAEDQRVDANNGACLN